jgi:hypothetical protein
MDELRHKPQTTAAKTLPDTGRASHGHEANTVRIVPIVFFGGTLVVLTIVVLLLMRGVFHTYSTRVSQMQAQPSPLAATRQPPPEPRLQVLPAQDLEELREAEEARLSSYGWVDRATGVIHMPISQAIDLLVQQGMPVRTED